MTAAELKTLRDQRASSFEALKTLVDGAEKRTDGPGPGKFTGEEEAQYQRMNAELDSLDVRIERAEKLNQRAVWGQTAVPPSTVAGQPGESRADNEALDKLYATAYGEMPEEYRASEVYLRRATPGYRKAFRSYIKGGYEEMRSVPEARDGLVADVNVSGGFLAAPQQFVAQLIVWLKNLVFVRANANVIPVMGSGSLGAVSLEGDVNDPDWTAEIVPAAEDTGLAFGRRELHPHPLSKLVKISNKLLRIAALNPEAIALDRLAYKFSTTMENAYLNGNGVEQPLGAMVNSPQGIDTSRDVVSSNTTTAITADALIDCFHSIKAQYWAKLRWAFHRTVMASIRKLKDGDGQYLWNPGLNGTAANLILGKPYDVSEYMPNTMTAGSYVGLLCDWSYYWIADSLAFSVQRLIELYSLTNQVGLIGRAESDGMPVLPEAFARVQLHS